MAKDGGGGIGRGGEGRQKATAGTKIGTVDGFSRVKGAWGKEQLVRLAPLIP